MIQKVIELISKQKWAYNLAQRIIANKIIHHSCKLTPEYLINNGWVEDDDGYYSEPNIKDRDKVWVIFYGSFYKVWYGSGKTFIAKESSKEWFEQYYLLINKLDKMYSLAGI
jgi:hypothetical protein